MQFIGRVMYTEKSTGRKFIYDSEIKALVNRPNDLIKEINHTDFEKTYPRNYSEGDILTVKSLEEMTKYYAIKSNGSIEVPASFTTSMYKYCGKKVRIFYVDEDRDQVRYGVQEINKEKPILYVFSNEMFRIPNTLERF